MCMGGGGDCPFYITVPDIDHAAADIHLSTGMALMSYSETHQRGKKWAKRPSGYMLLVLLCCDWILNGGAVYQSREDIVAMGCGL